MDNLIFKLENIFINKDLNKLDFSFLENLYNYSRNNNINLYLISGYNKDFSKDFIQKNNLNKYFKKIFYIDNNYLNSLSEIDREHKNNQFEDKKHFDSYFKVYIINNNGFLNNKNTLFIGTDIWTDGYYISNYTKANFVLIKDKITLNSKPQEITPKTIHTIDLNLDSFKDIIENKKEFNNTALNNFAKKMLFKKLVGGIDFSNIDLSKVIKKKEK